MQANMVNRQTFRELELFCWSLPKYRSIRNAFKWFCETFISLLNEKFKRQKWNNKKRQSNIFCISSLTSTRSQQKPFSNRKDESWKNENSIARFNVIRWNDDRADRVPRFQQRHVPISPLESSVQLVRRQLFDRVSRGEISRQSSCHQNGVLIESVDDTDGGKPVTREV